MTKMIGNWRFAFGLRALLLWILAISVVLAVLRLKLNRVEEQQKALAAVKDVGGRFYFTHQEQGQVVGAPSPGPQWLKSVIGEDAFSEVDSLFLNGINPTPDLCSAIAKLTTTREVYWCWAKLTDDQLRMMNGLTRLERLHLEATQVSDQSVDVLSRFTNLKSLDLWRTRFSAAGIAKLRRALPNCCIEFYSVDDPTAAPSEKTIQLSPDAFTRGESIFNQH